GFDYLMVSGADKTPLAAVLRRGEQITPLTRLPQDRGEPLLTLEGTVYQVASVPVDQGEDNLGFLSVGERFDFAGFSTPAVLMRNGRVLLSNLSNVTPAEAEREIAGCGERRECIINLAGA